MLGELVSVQLAMAFHDMRNRDERRFHYGRALRLKMMYPMLMVMENGSALWS
jgi:hypothetical protein